MDVNDLKLLAEIIGRRMGMAGEHNDPKVKDLRALTYDMCEVIKFPSDYDHLLWHSEINRVADSYRH